MITGRAPFPGGSVGNSTNQISPCRGDDCVALILIADFFASAKEQTCPRNGLLACPPPDANHSIQTERDRTRDVSPVRPLRGEGRPGRRISTTPFSACATLPGRQPMFWRA